MLHRCTLFVAVGFIVFSLGSSVKADVPDSINYQGTLLDAGGNPVTTTVTVEFAIYDQPSGGTILWAESQLITPDAQGRFITYLGSGTLLPPNNPLDETIFATSERWLEITVASDPPMSRIPFTTVPYAYRSAATDDGGFHWSAIDSVLYTNEILGIARGGAANNILYGDSLHTMINFGVACTTGKDGMSDVVSATVGGGVGNAARESYSTVSGGINNVADYMYSTIGGGTGNLAQQKWTTVAGGSNNTAYFNFSSVGGGSENAAQGYHCAIAGGEHNTATGYAAMVPGGAYNYAAGEYSLAAGRRARAINPGCFVWADNTDADFSSTDSQQFLIRAGGGVGIGTNSPAAQLDVNGTAKMTGFEMPTGATDGYVLTSDASGIGTWQAPGAHWTEIDSVLYTNKLLGLARGGAANNVLYGDSLHTMVNLGVACTTGWNAMDMVYTTVSGGLGNAARQYYTTVAGGRENIAALNYCTVGGGTKNHAADYIATIAGGERNIAAGYASMIPGGAENYINGDYAFAAGRRAKAYNQGCFVWGDATNADVTANVDNRWVARASGGVYFYSDATLSNGVYLAASGNSWNSISDRDTKENFDPIDREKLLEKLAALPITKYNIKNQDPSVKHIGPVAQDFFAAFGCGESEKAINMEDADGIALAAIQGLYQQNQRQQQENAELRARIDHLETLVEKLVANQQR